MKKRSKKMLMNYYDRDTYDLCKNVSREAAFRWLAEANRFLVKMLGIKKFNENERRMREMGW